ncbi:MAG TPA: cytochrome c [Thermoanaerobaculia bacterium]|nr:cytochrome c [Thermoanaerobaculia bacterium]
MNARIGLALALLALLFVSCNRSHKAAPVAVAGPSQYELQIGKEVYQTYCLGCHGETGAGDGFNSFNLDPHPRDLGDPAFQKKKTTAELADAVRRGGTGVGLSSLMPPWGHTLDSRRIDAVVLYVRSLRR